MNSFHVRTFAVAFAAGTFALAGCGGDDAPTATSSHDAETPGTAAAPATDATDPTIEAVATNDTIPTDPTGGPGPAGSPLPTDDPAALRDELLELAVEAPFGQTGSGPDFTIIEAWLAVHADLARTLFDDQLADATTISSSSAFLMEDLRAPGEQAFAWAVLGTDGDCAGAVAVIPGNPDGSVSDSGLPTIFAPVDDLATCSARGALEAYAAAG